MSSGSAECQHRRPGGPIGLVKDGDMVSIYLEKGVLDLEVAADVLEERRKAWAPPKKELKGILKLYVGWRPGPATARSGNRKR